MLLKVSAEYKLFSLFQRREKKQAAKEKQNVSI